MERKLDWSMKRKDISFKPHTFIDALLHARLVMEYTERDCNRLLHLRVDDIIEDLSV